MGTMSIPTHLPPPPIDNSRNYFGLAGAPPGPAPPLPPSGLLPPGGFMSLPPALPMAPAGALSYPSQDPSRMGAAQGNF